MIFFFHFPILYNVGSIGIFVIEIERKKAPLIIDSIVFFFKYMERGGEAQNLVGILPSSTSEVNRLCHYNLCIWESTVSYFILIFFILFFICIIIFGCVESVLCLIFHLPTPEPFLSPFSSLLSPLPLPSPRSYNSTSFDVKKSKIFVLFFWGGF